jgi:hypothetical protein
MFGMGKSAAAGGIDYPEERFTADDGKEHRLFWRAESGRHVAAVASDQPRDAAGYLATLKPSGTPSERVKLIDATIALLKKVEGLSAAIDKVGPGALSDAEKQTKRAELTRDDKTIAGNLKHILATLSISKAKEKYLVEGVTGTYSTLSQIAGKGDRMTPDHQPQYSVVDYAARLVDAHGGVFAGTTMSTYAHGAMVSINLHHKRHVAGRTYGRKPDATTVGDMVKVVADTTMGRPAKIAAILGLLAREARDDAKKIVDAVTAARGQKDSAELWSDVRELTPTLDKTARDELIDAIADQVIAGEKKIVQQDFERLGK